MMRLFAAALLFLPACGDDDDDVQDDGGVGPPDSSVDADAGDADVPEGTYVERDELGTPFIYAGALPDAAFALGWSMAADHTPFLVRQWVMAEGRLAEMLGRGDHDTNVRSDLIVRGLRIFEASEELYPDLGVEVRSWIESFAAGATRWLDENDDPRVAWAGSYRPTAQTVLAAVRMRDVFKQLAVAQQDIARWDPTGKLECPTYVFEDDSQSNAWAVGAPLVAGANAILAGDPHLPWDLDPTDGRDDGYFTYEAHFLVAGQRFGGGFPLGDPLAGAGYTDRVAWSATHSGADIADAYHLEPASPGSYWLGDEERPIQTREVDIAVQGEEPSVQTLTDSELGPVICVGSDADPLCQFDGSQEAFALVLPSIDSSNFTTRWTVLSIDSVQEALDGMRPQEIDENNVVFVDRDGGLLYHLAARIPARNEKTCYARAVASTDSRALPSFDGEGRLVLAPFEDHPAIMDPALGYLVNNNVSPQATHAGLEGEDLPWHNGLFDPNFGERGGYRQQRARAFFDAAGAGEVDLAASMELAWNTEVVPWPVYLEILERLVDESPELLEDDDTAAAIAALQEWNGSVESESAAPLLFVGWAARLDRLPVAQGGIKYLSPTPAESLTEAQLAGALDALVSTSEDEGACLPGVIPWLDAQYDSTLVSWGEVHYLLLPGEDSGRARPLASGDRFLQTLWMSNASLECPTFGAVTETVRTTEGGSSFMMQVAFTPELEVHVVKSKGDLSDPADPLYGAMSDLFASRSYRAVQLDGPSPDAVRLEVE